LNWLRTIARLLFRDFDAASGGPRSVASAWATMASPVRSQLAARYQLAAKGHYQTNNSPSAASVADVWTTSLVGDGPSVRSGHPNEAIRGALEKSWASFYETTDAEGVHDLLGMLNAITRSLVVAGEAIVLLTTTRRGELRLRLLSPEQLDPALTREAVDMSRIIAGVEFSAAGERIAYHIFPQHPDLGSPMTWAPVRIPAVDVLHLFDSRTPGQVRGTSWLAPVLTRLQELDRLEDALLARANTAALFGGFVTDVDGSGSALADASQGNPRELTGMEPGSLRYLPPGASISFPNMPSADDMPDVLRHLLRSIASGVGMPYELLAGDLSTVNYSSAKLGLEAYKRRIAALRASLLDARLLRPVWRRHVTLEILSGRLYAPDFERDPEPYFAVTFQWPGFAALDPLKEAQADIALLQSGLRSRAEIIASRGRDIEDVDREFAADTFRPIVRPAQLTTGEPNDAA
jgi:lambda family phage portal protein